MHPLGVVGGLGEDAIGGLAATLDGEVVLPDDGAYDAVRDVWNGLINRYPAVVVEAATAADVAEAVGFAREHALALSVRSGGHEQSGSAIASNGVVVDLSGLDHLRVDPDEQVAAVGPGNSTADALAATQEHGLAFPTGSAGSPGVAGTTLGGGVGWIRRKHGLAVDALRSVELVTADGEVRTVTAETHPDLFWAVRGGGSNFGVVTNLEFDCYEVGPLVGGLSVFYPRDAAEAVFDAFREFTADAPPEATVICNYAEVPAIPGMPPELHGEPAVALIGCYAGDPEEGMGVFAPLREVTEPLVDNSEPVPYAMLHELGTMLHPWGRKYVHRSAFVDELTDDLGAFLLERTEAAPGPMDGVGIWPMGGAIGSGPDAAYAWSDKPYLVVVEAAWESHDSPTHLSWARETERELRERGAEGAYAGYVGVEEQSWEDWAVQAYGENRGRLRALKREYDPENVFDHNVNVTPAADDGERGDGS
jgi:FAD/FMN-containing dehydrogenase